ncbi:MAG: iron-sulfur cluster assembly scaffold protein [Pseudomonadota bacterium]|nr:iron-sulfur cluster assembly scaffold protein [Pseudomonadota bacterium]
MMNELYNQRILQLAAEVPHLGRLAAPGAQADAVSRLCGSRVHVELCLDVDGRVTDFAHELQACALGQASSSVMAREIIGSSAKDLRAVAGQMRAMLKENGPVPSLPDSPEKWKDLEVLTPVRDFHNRHASTLLTFDAVEDCLNQLGW